MPVETDYTEDDLRAAIRELADEAPHPIQARTATHRTPSRRRLLAPLAVTVVVLLVATLAVVLTHHGSHAPTLAVGPTEATRTHPCRSTTTPEFDTFTVTGSYRRVSAETTCSGYRSQSVVLAGTVVLYRPDVFDLSLMSSVRRVSAHGINGYAGRLEHDPSRECDVGSLRQDNCAFDVVAWHYTDDAWGVVEGSPGQSANSLLKLASRVRPTPKPVRFPIRFRYLPPGLHASRVSFVDAYGLQIEPGRRGSYFAHLVLGRGTAVGASIAVAPAAGHGRSAGHAVSIGHDTAYLTTTAQARNRLSLRHGDCDVVVTARQPTSQAQLIRMMRSATFADCGDARTWPAADDALPHQ